VQGVAHVDVAGFKFKTPADTSDGTNSLLNFYFAYLGATGTWDNETKTGAIVGAAAEISSNILSINAWYDRDGTEGLHWDIGANTGVDVFNCDTGTYDCVDIQGGVDMKKDLVWTPLTRSEVSCAGAVTTGAENYDANCKINTLSTSGELPSNPGVSVVSITARTCSQPLLINGVQHSPDKAKWDVKINYPWANKTTLKDAANAKVALFALHAGKAGAGGVGVKVSGETKSLTFTAAGGRAAYFGYVPTAMIAGASTTITTQTITAAEINAFDCTGKPCAGLTGTNYITGVLKVVVGWLTNLGWTPQLTVHSFATVHPTQIDWDPEVGVTPNDNTSAAGLLVPGLGMLVACLFY
jgi:hypothetical protein